MGIYYQTALVLHIIGMCIMVGGTVAQFAGLRFFWRHFTTPGQKAHAMLTGSLLPGRLVGGGFMLLLVSGTAMLSITDWVYTAQFWFRVKFSIIVVMVITSIALQSRQEKNLLAMVGGEERHGNLHRARTRLDLRLFTELAAFIAIFVMAIFKFN